jgi:hypothetical protein
MALFYPATGIKDRGIPRANKPIKKGAKKRYTALTMEIISVYFRGQPPHMRILKDFLV